MAECSALFVHGAGGGGWEWNHWHRRWQAQGMQVCTPDLQPARAGVQATRWQDYRDQVEQWQQALPRPYVLVGASLGGLLALQAAAGADALIVINPVLPMPWHTALPPRVWPDQVPWRTQARWASTRRAMPDADPASVLYALRRWRDESGAVLRAAWAGIAVPPLQCPALFIVSEADQDVPPQAVRSLAVQMGGQCWSVPGGHVEPLLGSQALDLAGRALSWLNQVVAMRQMFSGGDGSEPAHDLARLAS